MNEYDIKYLYYCTLVYKERYRIQNGEVYVESTYHPTKYCRCNNYWQPVLLPYVMERKNE